MRILYIKLVNFVGVNAAMNLKEIDFDFSKVNKSIIQIYGKNRCGKTVLLQQLHPYSTINLNGDERNDLSLIIPGEVGIKNIVYEVNENVYNITHTYKPTSKGNHIISSSILCDGQELNPAGNVNTFNTLIESLLGINKYTFQLLINGTQLTSFANMSSTQRKTLLNKAMGIDIYDKIHKMATDDYRYTNKLIQSLTNTTEYILSKYGSVDTLSSLLNNKKYECDTLSRNIINTKSNVDKLQGEINILQQQNIDVELININQKLNVYKSYINKYGEYNDNLYDSLINTQMKLNDQLNELKIEWNNLIKDCDILCAKRTEMNNKLNLYSKNSNDYNDMENFINDLKCKINDLKVNEYVDIPSSHLNSLLTIARSINTICKEILVTLNDKDLKIFIDLINNKIDVSAYIIQQSSVLLDAEKETETINRVRNMLSSIHGEIPSEDECCKHNCLYRHTYENLEMYFKSYQDSISNNNELTQIDLNQLSISWKNLQTIERLLNIDIPDCLKYEFNIITITNNLLNKEYGVDVNRINYLIEESVKNETRIRLIQQLQDSEEKLNNMKIIIDSNGCDNLPNDIDKISNEIDSLNNKLNTIKISISDIENKINNCDEQRLSLSQIKNINVSELNMNLQKYTNLLQQLNESKNQYNIEYNNLINLQSEYNSSINELNELQNTMNQYDNTIIEINKNKINDKEYKVIAEATSSTKGKPVIAIRNTVDNALSLSNRLLDVMYDGELELLKPIIDETTFTLPFRCGLNKSNDLMYGSQSESTMLSLALSLSLASTIPNTSYNICLLDEIDAYLDQNMKEAFILMIQEMMLTLKMEQLFIISHGTDGTSYPSFVHILNLSDEIDKRK